MNIKSFGITIVTFLLISSVISMMAPKGSISKTLKFVLSICLILVTISTVKSIKIDLPKINNTNININEDNYYLQTLNVTKEILQNKILNDLEKNEIKLEKIEINADISDDNSIIIDSVIYKSNIADQFSLIEKIIYENTGCRKIERETDEKNITE